MPRSRSLACLCALLGASVAAPATAVPVSPIAAQRMAPLLDDVVTAAIAEAELCVTFDEIASQPEPAVKAQAPSVLLSNDSVGGFGYVRDRLGEAEADE